MAYTWKEPPIPWFVVGFLAVGGVNSMGWIPAPAVAALTQTSIFLMAIAMAAMGLNTDWALLRKAGVKAFATGATGFFALAAFAYTVIVLALR